MHSMDNFLKLPSLTNVAACLFKGKGSFPNIRIPWPLAVSGQILYLPKSIPLQFVFFLSGLTFQSTWSTLFLLFCMHMYVAYRKYVVVFVSVIGDCPVAQAGTCEPPASLQGLEWQAYTTYLFVKVCYFVKFSNFLPFSCFGATELPLLLREKMKNCFRYLAKV